VRIHSLHTDCNHVVNDEVGNSLVHLETALLVGNHSRDTPGRNLGVPRAVIPDKKEMDNS